MSNFQEHKLSVYTGNLKTILLLSMLLYSTPYSMAKSKSLLHLLNPRKHPQTCQNNIALSCKNGQSISRSLVPSKSQLILPPFFLRVILYDLEIIKN